MPLIIRFHGHEKTLAVEMREQALEGVDPVTRQVNRLQEEWSSSLDERRVGFWGYGRLSSI